MPEEIPKDAFKRTPPGTISVRLYAQKVPHGDIEVRVCPDRSLCRISLEGTAFLEELTLQIIDGRPRFTEMAQEGENDPKYASLTHLIGYLPLVLGRMQKSPSEHLLYEFLSVYYRNAIN